jgi:tetratricopeptide (TPR) repeat protein
MFPRIFSRILMISFAASLFTPAPCAPSKSALLTEGKQLFWSGDYKGAGKKIDQAIAQNPADAEAHYFLGYLHQRENPATPIPDLTWESTDRVSREFELVLKLEPDYTGEIICLAPREKIMSEWSALALASLYAGNGAKARIAFEEAKKRGGTIPEIEEFMKNMLLSCPPDAVLITGGDMDTFFPLYFQVMEGLRTDVTILNISLCQTPWFLKMITKNLPWQKQPLSLPFSEKDLKNIDKLLKDYQKPFTMTIPKPGCENPNDSLGLDISPTAQADGKPHVLLSDLVFLHVLKDNARRPLCIAPWVRDRTLNYRIYVDGKPLDPMDHLEKQGLVDLLTLCPSEGTARIDATERLLAAFSYKALPNSERINACYGGFPVNHYIAAFVQTADLLEKRGFPDRSRALLSKLVELVPGIRYLKDEKQREYLLGIAGKPIDK